MRPESLHENRRRPSRHPAGPMEVAARRRGAGLLAAALVLTALVGVAEPQPAAASTDDSPSPPRPVFEEVTAAAGLDFTHFNGMSGELYMLEVVGAGVAFFDYDGDGDLDLYVGQGAMLGPGKGLEEALFPPRSPLGDRLYRNDSVLRPDGTVELRFVDVTEQAGLDAGGYAMGVAVADATGNGCPDLYLANFGPNQLWRNNCDGTFTDITAEAGVDDPRWSVAATFFDMNGNGHLDLFVVNYVDFTFENHRVCVSGFGAEDYCSPLTYRPVPDRLLRNRGDGTFEDVTEEAGILDAPAGMGLGVVVSDLDGNGRLDLYVANDLAPNHLWVNEGDGTFIEQAVMAGAAVNLDGQPEASMGIAIGDVDGSGRESIFLTHLFRETNTLYRNLGGGVFEDATRRSGLGRPSWEYTGFGTGFFDFDHDGWLDLLVVNGAVQTKEALARAGSPFPLHEPNQLFRNQGGGRFVEVTGELGAAFAHSEVSRGAAFGDLDNDGRVDFAVSNNNGPLRLYLNRTESANHWLGLRVVDPSSGADRLYTHLEVTPEGGSARHRWVRTDGSYVAAQDPRVVVGLGPSPRAERVRATAPGGGTVEWHGLPPDRYYTLLLE